MLSLGLDDVRTIFHKLQYGLQAASIIEFSVRSETLYFRNFKSPVTHQVGNCMSWREQDWFMPILFSRDFHGWAHTNEIHEVFWLLFGLKTDFLICGYTNNSFSFFGLRLKLEPNHQEALKLLKISFTYLIYFKRDTTISF